MLLVKLFIVKRTFKQYCFLTKMFRQRIRLTIFFFFFEKELELDGLN